MGFDPAGYPVMHQMEVAIVGSTFNISITDGSNSSNVFTTTYTSSLYTPGDRIGLTIEGRSDEGVFDNFTVTSTEAQAVPEPMTILGTLTALGFGTAFKRRQAKS